MITAITIEGFKCFKHLEIKGLGPFNVLIGANDTGKTAFLQAVLMGSIAVQQGGVNFGLMAGTFGVDVGDHIPWGGKAKPSIIIDAGDRANAKVCSAVLEYVPYQGFGLTGTAQRATLEQCVGGAHYFYLDPSVLRSACLVSEGQGMFAMSSTGEGFATFLEDILRTDRRRFFEMEKAFYEKFPQYEKFNVSRKGTENSLTFETKDGTVLPAQQVSDGAILYLAFLAITHQPSPPKMLLIEEPENGVHFASLKDIVAALRTVTEDGAVQVFMTTHSPYLLDLVEPEQVLIFQKEPNGSVSAKRMSEFPDVADMKKHFETGEIWTNLMDKQPAGKAEGE